MCLIAFAWHADARYPLVVAANRDEFHARPTASAAWSDDGETLAGRDLRGGGTWMGVTRSGRFVALTNHRDPATQRADAPSRGALVDRTLATDDVGRELATIARDAVRYNGFNLIVAEWRGAGSMKVVSHPGDAPTAIEPGIHAVSNARLDTPWPKVDAARRRLRAALDATRHEGEGDALVARLFALLSDEHVADDASLPSTGVPLSAERALSAAFIRLPDYGTRSSTVFVTDRAGRAVFVERRFEPGMPMTERRFAFDVAGVGDRLSAGRAA